MPDTVRGRIMKAIVKLADFDGGDPPMELARRLGEVKKIAKTLIREYND